MVETKWLRLRAFSNQQKNNAKISLEMNSSSSERSNTASENARELMGHSSEEENVENVGSLESDSDGDLSESESQKNINNESSSLDVLSKLACENISEPSEFGSDPVLGGPSSQDYEATNTSDKTSDEAIVTDLFEDYVCVEPDSSMPDNIRVVRKSSRTRRPRQFSPDVSDRLSASKRPRPSAQPKSARAKRKTDAPFKCDLCGSPHIIDPTRRGNRAKTSVHSPSPRRKVDPETGKMLILCNACGLSFNRPKVVRHKAVCDPEAKKSYLDEGRQFAASLVEGLGDQDASRLFCPRFKTSACACLQKHVIAEGNMDESRERAQNLLNLLKQSKQLSKQKCYENTESEGDGSNMSERKGKRGKNIGLGNGQRKSKEFEEFILEQRKYLREELKLCEQATQRVLSYSNNFLHKRLKTDPTKPLRVERQKGMAVLGKLKPIEELAREPACCVDKCVSMALTHSKLLREWRDRSASGQAEARRVLAEMLTPSGGARSNCYKFISWVTGCSHSTIGRVNEQMKKTGGDREPPVHGLVNWWKEHPKPKKAKPKSVSHNSSTHGVQLLHLTNAQLQPLGLLQTAANSVGIPTAVLASQIQNNSQVLASPQVLTINPTHLAINGSSQAASRQMVLTATQHTQLQIQQLQQQQQQLQMQTIQLQQQLQQQIQQEQHLQQQSTDQNVQLQLPNQVMSSSDGNCLSLAQSHEFPTASFTSTLHPVSQVQCANNGTLGTSSQSSLSTDNFLSSDTLQILNSSQVQTVAPHVVTLQCSTEPSATQAVPVSLIQTPVSLSL